MPGVFCSYSGFVVVSIICPDSAFPIIPRTFSSFLWQNHFVIYLQRFCNIGRFYHEKNYGKFVTAAAVLMITASLSFQAMAASKSCPTETGTILVMGSCSGQNLVTANNSCSVKIPCLSDLWCQKNSQCRSTNSCLTEKQCQTTGNCRVIRVSFRPKTLYGYRNEIFCICETKPSAAPFAFRYASSAILVMPT